MPLLQTSRPRGSYSPGVDVRILFWEFGGGGGRGLTILNYDFRSDVRHAPTDSRGAQPHLAHFFSALSAGFAEAGVDAREDLRDTEVGDLDLARAGHEEVFQLDIAMRDAVLVEVVDALHELLEDAESVIAAVGAGEVVLLHEAEEVAFLAVFHHMIPSPVVRAEAYALYDVRVVQALRDAEFRLDLLLVVLLYLARSLAAEFLDGMQLRPALARHECNFRGRTLTERLATSANEFALVGKFLVQVHNVNPEVVWQTQTHAPCLQARSGLGREPPLVSRELGLL